MQRQGAPVLAGGVLEHRLVAVRVAARQDRPPADVQVDVGRLALLVVVAAELGQLDQHRAAVSELELDLAAAADDLGGRDAVDLLREDAHEVDPAAGDDPGLEAVGAQVGEQLQHRLVDAVRVGSLEAGMLRRADPVPDDRGELVGGHPGVDGRDRGGDILLGQRGQRLPVVGQDRLEGLLSCHSGCSGASARMRSRANKSWK